MDPNNSDGNHNLNPCNLGLSNAATEVDAQADMAASNRRGSGITRAMVAGWEADRQATMPGDSYGQIRSSGRVEDEHQRTPRVVAAPPQMITALSQPEERRHVRDLEVSTHEDGDYEDQAEDHDESENHAEQAHEDDLDDYVSHLFYPPIGPPTEDWIPFDEHNRWSSDESEGGAEHIEHVPASTEVESWTPFVAPTSDDLDSGGPGYSTIYSEGDDADGVSGFYQQESPHDDSQIVDELYFDLWVIQLSPFAASSIRLLEERYYHQEPSQPIGEPSDFLASFGQYIVALALGEMLQVEEGELRALLKFRVKSGHWVRWSSQRQLEADLTSLDPTCRHVEVGDMRLVYSVPEDAPAQFWRDLRLTILDARLKYTEIEGVYVWKPGEIPVYWPRPRLHQSQQAG